MRNYLLKGGFLWVDDFWGTLAWQQWSSEIKRVLPEYQIIDIPMDHPVRHMLFDVKTIPQVTAIQNWRGSGFSTSERGSDSPRQRPCSRRRRPWREGGRVRHHRLEHGFDYDLCAVLDFRRHDLPDVTHFGINCSEFRVVLLNKLLELYEMMYRIR
jgi:hypothetical protein